MPKYKDDQFVTITNEFEQIQKCVGMYISSGGTTGAIHLFKERTLVVISKPACFNSLLKLRERTDG